MDKLKIGILVNDKNKDGNEFIFTTDKITLRNLINCKIMLYKISKIIKQKYNK